MGATPMTMSPDQTAPMRISNKVTNTMYLSGNMS